MNPKISNSCWRTIRAVMLTVSFGCALAAAPSVKADEGVVGSNVTYASLQTDYIDGIGTHNYRPVKLSGYYDGGSNPRYATRWVRNTDDRPWIIYKLSTGAELTQIATTLKGANWRPIDVSGFAVSGGAVRFASIWEPNRSKINWIIQKDQTVPQMSQLLPWALDHDYKIRKLEGYVSGGNSKFVSIWEQEHIGNIPYWQCRMTASDYNLTSDKREALGDRLVGLDSHTVNGTTYYSAIWLQNNRAQLVRSHRDAFEFQRYSNNYWAKGYNVDSIFAVETPNGPRWGAIWVYDEPRPTTSLADQIAASLFAAPGRGGGFVYNLTTNQTTAVSADQIYALASSAKIGILYALLRRIDSTSLAWNTGVNSGSTMGQNNNNRIAQNTNYTVQQLAGFMIADSNNWATNLIIKLLTRGVINQELSNAGLQYTRVNRMMMGTGAPSLNGYKSSYDDHKNGIENTGTPREVTTLLRRIWTDNLLSNTSQTRFWATMALDSNGGLNSKGYCGGVVNMFIPRIQLFNKAGNVDDIRAHRAEGGRMQFPDGQQVFYMFCMDNISDNPDDTAASNTALSAAGNAIGQAGAAVATQYYK